MEVAGNRTTPKGDDWSVVALIDVSFSKNIYQDVLELCSLIK
jgi:hypothetical protein